MEPHTDDEQSSYYSSSSEQLPEPSQDNEFQELLRKIRQREPEIFQNVKPKQVKVDKYSHLKKNTEKVAVPELPKVIMHTDVDEKLEKVLKIALKLKKAVVSDKDQKQLDEEDFQENEMNKVDNQQFSK